MQAWKVCVPKGTAGSNPAFSAERDLGLKKELSPFFIIAKSPDCRAISAITEFTLGVRNVPVSLSNSKSTLQLFVDK